MTQIADYTPVPVAAAKSISEQCDKSMVIILAWDPVHKMTHCTTYGRNADEKLVAAHAGERCTAALGGSLTHRQTFEDFRERPAAEAAETIDRLKRRVQQLESYERELSACRDLAQQHHPLGSGKFIGMLETSAALAEILAATKQRN